MTAAGTQSKPTTAHSSPMCSNRETSSSTSSISRASSPITASFTARKAEKTWLAQSARKIAGGLLLATAALALSEIDAFYGDSHVLHGVSLRLGEGRLLGLLGRNGAGKSTSMNVTVGLLPPRHGAVTVFGSAVTGRTPEAIAAQGVALVPQGRRVFRSLTVRENLAVAGRQEIRVNNDLREVKVAGVIRPEETRA